MLVCAIMEPDVNRNGYESLVSMRVSLGSRLKSPYLWAYSLCSGPCGFGISSRFNGRRCISRQNSGPAHANSHYIVVGRSEAALGHEQRRISRVQGTANLGALLATTCGSRYLQRTEEIKNSRNFKQAAT